MDQNRQIQEAVREKGSVPETELNVTQLKVISSAKESLSHRWRVGRVRDCQVLTSFGEELDLKKQNV